MENLLRKYEIIVDHPALVGAAEASISEYTPARSSGSASIVLNQLNASSSSSSSEGPSQGPIHTQSRVI